MRQLLFFALAVLLSAFARADQVYEVQLRHAIASKNLAPVVLVLHERNGAFVRGMALAPHVYPEPAPKLDCSGLTLEGDRLTGSFKTTWRTPVYNQHPERPQVTFETDYALDVTFDGARGSGLATGTVTTPRDAENKPPTISAVAATPIVAARRAVVAYPKQVQFELALYYGDYKRGFGWMSTRFTVYEGKADRGFCLYRGHTVNSGPAAIEMLFDGKSLNGTWRTDLTGQRTQFKITGVVIDRFVSVEAEMTTGDQAWSCGGQGRANLAQRRLPETAATEATWQYAYQYDPDPELVGKAAELAMRPLGVLRASESTLLWTWRMVLQGSNKNGYKLASSPITAIHPLAFDFAEIPGASSYRYTLSGETGTHTFVAEAPSSSLVPVWGRMAPGDYTLKMVGLDRDGTELPAIMAARYLLRDEHGGLGTKVGSLPLPEGIRITKRAAFQGPYFDAPRDGYAAALASARYVREGQHLAPFKGLLPYPGMGSLGGDGKQNYRLMDHSMANLIVYRFSEDPQERAEALRSALHAGEAGEFDTLVSPVGLVGTYKFNSNTHNVAGDAFLNLYEFTGEKRWKEAALRFARGLASFQKPNGSFEWVTGGGQVYETADHFGVSVRIDCNPSEILSFFGRLRHELKTDEFLRVERKALAFLLRWTKEEFTWLEVGPHSHVWNYPLQIHSRSPQHLAFYLLSFAAEEDRDLDLVEELALWSEDRNISWERVEPRADPLNSVHPHGFGSCDGYRSSGPPASFVSRLALVYLKLYEYTGKRLHREKARALFASVVQAQHVQTGYLNRSQICTTVANDYPHYKHQLIGHTLRYLIDYEKLARHLGVSTVEEQ